MQWSEITGTLRDDLITPVLLVIQRSKMFLSLVGSFCTKKGVIIQARQKMFALPLVGR